MNITSSSNSEIGIGFLVGGSLLVAFLGTAGITLACLYYRREKGLGGSLSDKEKNNRIIHHSFSNSVLMSPASESYGDSWDNYIAYITMIPERPFGLHCELDEKRVSKQTHESESLASVNISNTNINNNTNVDDDKIFCEETVDKNHAEK
ncbi:1845_t:CDS:2 [Racocetra fulgida]|uniref:1845_t:CDS:1 n=1 Tax=Racocetra fulgida TaxID=60492 RepID=A0A9N9F464_9GLOM|nr:1845_t:CDS:2 [Racocetra fulgida]